VTRQVPGLLVEIDVIILRDHKKQGTAKARRKSQSPEFFRTLRKRSLRAFKGKAAKSAINGVVANMRLAWAASMEKRRVCS